MSEHTAIPASVQTLIWDLDGTLLDSFGIYQDSLNRALRKHGRPEAPEQLLRRHHHGLIEESIAEVLRDMDQQPSKAELAQIIVDFYLLDNAYIKDADHHLFKDAIGLAERAHQAGKRQIIVTNRWQGTDRGNGSPRNIVANSRLHQVIDDVLCGDDSTYRKPQRECLEARFGADLAHLGEIMVIGDQFVDAEFARNLDGHAVLVARVDTIPHLERLGPWKNYVRIVSALHDVQV